MNSASDDNTTSEKRKWGRFYTPPEIVRLMMQLSGDVVDSTAEIAGRDVWSKLPTILDPACGDGALLLAAFDRVNACRAAEPTGSREGFRRRLEIVQKQLFGVDVDQPAVERLRAGLLERVAPPPADAPAAARAIAANIRVGDALTGGDFSSPLPASGESGMRSANEPAPVNWDEAFPAVAAQGGFDVVICNPPYLREKNAKPMFDRIAETPLGRTWREPRMDLWYYFVHRSLDLLKPDGMLTFIVNSYWAASSGSRRMTERLRTETTLHHVILLGDRPVFDGVAGRHLIFSLRRNHSDVRCRVLDLSKTPSIENVAVDDPEGDAAYSLAREELFCDRAIRFDRPEPDLLCAHPCTLLGEAYEVRQGIAENPPRLSRRHCEILGDAFTAGQGVFVLTSAEVEQLGFTPVERELLRPYYRPMDLAEYALPPETDLSLLYLTKDTAPDLNGLPNIRRHLQRFRPILERRRETRLGKVAWWHLHWPRQERLFTEPRILSVQMAQRPRFAWGQRATFVGFSVNVIAETADSPFALSALCGILNSAAARQWFTRRSKKRGINLEISGGLLRTFPLPSRHVVIEKELSRLVGCRQQHVDGTPGVDSTSAVPVDDEIDRCVESLYAATSVGPAASSAPQRI